MTVTIYQQTHLAERDVKRVRVREHDIADCHGGGRAAVVVVNVVVVGRDDAAEAADALRELWRHGVVSVVERCHR